MVKWLVRYYFEGHTYGANKVQRKIENILLNVSMIFLQTMDKIRKRKVWNNSTDDLVYVSGRLPPDYQSMESLLSGRTLFQVILWNICNILWWNNFNLQEVLQ